MYHLETSWEFENIIVMFGMPQNCCFFNVKSISNRNTSVNVTDATRLFNSVINLEFTVKNMPCADGNTISDLCAFNLITDWMVTGNTEYIQIALPKTLAYGNLIVGYKP